MRTSRMAQWILAPGGKKLEMIYPALHNNLVTGQVMMLEKSYVTISIQMVKFPGSGTFYNLPDLIVILLAQFVF